MLLESNLCIIMDKISMLVTKREMFIRDFKNCQHSRLLVLCLSLKAFWIIVPSVHSIHAYKIVPWRHYWLPEHKRAVNFFLLRLMLDKLH